MFRRAIWNRKSRNKNPAGRRVLSLETMEDRRLLTTVDLASLLQDDGTMIFGADPGDLAGTVGSAGDLNGDGYDDFLIAASHGDGLGNLKPNAGEIYIVFGGPSMPATIDLANLGSAGITIFGPNENARLYSGSSAGDLNGDGYEDLVLGHGGPPNNFGAVYVIFGGPSLRNRHTIDLADSDAADVTIGGVDYLVGGRGAGDVNRDGFADLILGAGDGDGGGKSYLIFGGASLPANIDLANLGSAGVTYYGANGTGNYRVSGADDVDGDGYGDFLISSMFGPDVYLIYGSSSLAENALVDLSNLGPSAGVTIRSASIGRGWDAAGDFNGDGYGDLVVVSGDAYYVIYGGPTLPPLIELDRLGTPGVEFTGVKFTGGGNIEAVGIGEVNGDGIDDLLLAGAYSATELGYTYLVFGSRTMEPTIDLTNLGNRGVAFRSIDLNESRPRVSRAGDVNGDGFEDFLIGVENGDGPNNSRVDAGESYLIYGGAYLRNANSRKIFADSFEIGEWNGNWVEDSQNDWFRSTQRATAGSYSAEVDGFANDATLTLNNALDLSGTSSATLTFDWLIESGFDWGEYLALDISLDGGANWAEGVRQLNGDVSQEDVWHSEIVNLSPYATNNLKIRFRSLVSASNEDANVDNVRIVAAPLVPNDPPVADAGAAQIGDEDSVVTFDASGSTDPENDVLTYLWDFGDGQTAQTTLPTVGHIYAYGGTFVVTLTVLDSQGNQSLDTTTATIAEINDVPVANIGSGYSGYENQTVTFDASASQDFDNVDGTNANDQVLTYYWNFGDGHTAITNIPAVDHVFATAGSYLVSLVIHDGIVASLASQTTVQISTQPVDNSNKLYVYDIRFESRKGGKEWRAVFEIRRDSDAGSSIGDAAVAGVTIGVIFGDVGDDSHTGTTDANGIFRTSWLGLAKNKSYYANVVGLTHSLYDWSRIDDLEDDSDGDGFPDDLLSL